MQRILHTVCMAPTAEFVENIQRVYLQNLIKLMKAADISLPYSQAASRDFLALFPVATMEQLDSRLRSYCTAHPKFMNVHIEFLRLKEQTQTKELLTKMRTLMKNDKPGAALHIVGASSL